MDQDLGRLKRDKIALLLLTAFFLSLGHEDVSNTLTQAQINHFIYKGFIRIDHAFDAALAEEARRILWEDMDCDPKDPDTWTKPVIWLGMYSQPPTSQK
ncbi:MAG TPA: hypothetical protein VGE90_14750 [Chitinophaga sp.]